MFFFLGNSIRCAAVQQQSRNILNSRARRDGGGGAGAMVLSRRRYTSRTSATQTPNQISASDEVLHPRHRSGPVPPGGVQKVKCDEYEVFLQQWPGAPSNRSLPTKSNTIPGRRYYVDNPGHITESPVERMQCGTHPQFFIDAHNGVDLALVKVQDGGLMVGSHFPAGSQSPSVPPYGGQPPPQPGNTLQQLTRSPHKGFSLVFRQTSIPKLTKKRERANGLPRCRCLSGYNYRTVF